MPLNGHSVLRLPVRKLSPPRMWTLHSFDILCALIDQYLRGASQVKENQGFFFFIVAPIAV